MNTYRYKKTYKNGFKTSAKLIRYPAFCGGFILADIWSSSYDYTLGRVVSPPHGVDIYKDLMDWIDRRDNFYKKKWLVLADNKMKRKFCPNGLATWLVKQKKWKLMNTEGNITSGVTGNKVAIWTFSRQRIGTRPQLPRVANQWEEVL